MERINFSPSPNPFSRGYFNEKPILISSSSIRERIANFSHILIGSKYIHPNIFAIINKEINKAEEKTQKRISEELSIQHSIFPPRRSTTSPIIMMELSTDKARAAIEVIQRLQLTGQWKEEWGEIPTSIATVDSAWAIDLTPNNSDDIIDDAVFIQKPKNKNGLELIIKNLKVAGQRGGHLQSVSGICVVKIGINRKPYFKHGLVVVDYGKINSNFDWQKLANIIEGNGHFAGGFSTIHLFSSLENLIINESGYVKVQLITGENQPDKRIPSIEKLFKNQQTFEISFDKTNIENLIALSVGLIPQL